MASGGVVHVYRPAVKLKMTLYCGKDIIHRATDRCSMLSDACSKALPIWKRLVAERFDELKIDVDVNPVGSTAKTSFPLTKAANTSLCFSFRINPRRLSTSSA